MPNQSWYSDNRSKMNNSRKNARDLAESIKSNDAAAKREREAKSDAARGRIRTGYTEQGDKLQKHSTRMQNEAASRNIADDFFNKLDDAGGNSKAVDRLLSGARNGEYGRDAYKFACDVKMSQEVSSRSRTETTLVDRQAAHSQSQSSGEGGNGWILGVVLVVVVVIVVLAIFGI